MLRQLTLEDIPALETLLLGMHAESGLSDVEVHLPRSRFIMGELIKADDTFTVGDVTDDVLTGVLIGELRHHLFLEMKTAEDLFYYVAPEQRGRMGGIRLLAEFEGWAQEGGARAVAIQVSAGIADEKVCTMLERRGYKSGGRYMAKEV